MNNEAPIKRYIRKLNDTIHKRIFMDFKTFEDAVKKEIPIEMTYNWNGNLIPVRGLYLMHASKMVENGTKNLYDYFLSIVYPD